MTLLTFIQIYTDEKPVTVMTPTEQQEETKAKEYACEVCDAVFSLSSSIKEHMREHKRSRPLYCSRCDQYFVLGDNFTAHKQQHEVKDTVVCPECGKRYKSTNSLIAHMKAHETNETFECGICCKNFRTAALLITHMESHLSASVHVYACDICHEGARSQKFLERHKMNVHNIYRTDIYRFACKSCSRRFKKKQALSTHVMKAHSISFVEFLSGYCGHSSRKPDNHETSNRTNLTVSDSQENMDTSGENNDSQIRKTSLTDKADNPDFLKKHSLPVDSSVAETMNTTADFSVMDVHKMEISSAIHNKKNVMESVEALAVDKVKGSVADMVEENSDASIDMINECDVTSNSSSSRSVTPTSIESDTHKGDQVRKFLDKFVADTMGYSDEEKIEDNTEYNDKDKEENDESKFYKCDLCSHEFEGCKAIKQHMIQHNNLKPHYCTRCDLYFVLARNMRTHLIEHEAEDPVVCQLCNEVFHTTEGLNNHNLTHAEYFPHRCSHCQRGFQTQSTLSLHMRFHTNSAFQCSTCLDSFPSKQSLKMHMRNTHFIYEKRYRFGCDKCEIKFQGPEALRRHKRYSHNMPWSELIPEKRRKYFQKKRGGKLYL